MDLSIIIVNWNTRDLLKACLRSVYAETRGLTFEVFVVDNASTDGSPEMVRTEFPQVRLIQNNVNVGFAKANNQAIALSKGRYILLLNPDTLLRDNAFSRMVHFLRSHPDIGALGCKILTSEGKIDLRGAKGFPSLLGEFFELTRLSYRFPRSKFFGNYLMTYWDHEDSREVDVLSGACLMIRREALEQVGLFDERFFLYGAEVDWYYRLKRMGWKVFYYSEAEIIHIGSQSTRQLGEKMGLERFRSRYRLFCKHKGKGYARAYKALLCLVTVIKVLGFWIGFLGSTSSEKKRWYRRKIRLHRRVLWWILGGDL